MPCFLYESLRGVLRCVCEFFISAGPRPSFARDDRRRFNHARASGRFSSGADKTDVWDPLLHVANGRPVSSSPGWLPSRVHFRDLSLAASLDADTRIQIAFPLGQPPRPTVFGGHTGGGMGANSFATGSSTSRDPVPGVARGPSLLGVGLNAPDRTDARGERQRRELDISRNEYVRPFVVAGFRAS